MSGKVDKKLRKEVRRHQLDLLAKAIKEIQAWPFKRRLMFAYRIVFPPKVFNLGVKHGRP